MKKKDMIPVALLFVLLLAYPKIDEKFVSKIFPPKERPAPVETATPADLPADLPVEASLSAAPAAVPAAPESAPAETTEPAAPAEPAPSREKAPERLHVLANEHMEITLTTHGAGVLRAAMLDYPETMGSDAFVTFDFSDRPAAAPVGYPGLLERDDFELAAASDTSATFRKVLPGGLVLSRSLALGEGYQVRIQEEILNPTAAPVVLSGYGLQGGFMENLPGEKDERTPLLGIDTLTGSDSVKYWAGDFAKWFPALDRSIQRQPLPGPGKEPIHVDWAAVKNKYFTQILTPESGAESAIAFAARGAPVQSTFMFLFPKTDHPFARVAATLLMPDFELAPGQALAQNATWYIGPKVYSELRANGPHQEDILQLGFWRPIGILILKIMVWIQAKVWPYSYGLAIILLTFLIRIVFWPLNHKSMVSTRHMQEVQPLIAALKEKHKGDPQKQQQEMMALYKEHKINPMGGCLPMLVQIPVFFALFVVLRGAIELRFSSFLWIADLSTPENLFKDVLPIPINILPIFMGVTMWIQQKLTPAGGDPQQQRMMMMMPVIFTVMFYSFPSGLSLYWSVNQVLMIVQLAWMRKFHPSPAKK
jgi:YidC/Oxa1 family membrane protein insertase